MNRCFNTKKLAGVILAMVMAWMSAIPVYAKTEGIAVVESFKGEVIIESRGAWRKNPEKGTVVHHGDKIVTTDKSSLQIKFHDGSALDISSNSNVRVTQPVQRDVFAEEELGKREIRVFIGKTTYKSGEGKHVVTRMISPMAVAALRGTIVEFGIDSDDSYSFLRLIEGQSNNTGNITEVHLPLPDVTPEQAAKNPTYQMSLETWNAWQKYEQAKKDASPNANMLYVEVMKKIAESLVKENASLVNHPDELVKTRASYALKKSQESVQKADETLKTVKTLEQKEKELLKKSQNQPENKQASDLLIKAALQTQKAIRDAVEVSAQIADAYTAAMYDSNFVQKLEQTIANSTKHAKKGIESEDVDVLKAAFEVAEAEAKIMDAMNKMVQNALDGDKAAAAIWKSDLEKKEEIWSVANKKLEEARGPEFPKPTLPSQPPPLQDAKKVPTVTPYGQ